MHRAGVVVADYSSSLVCVYVNQEEEEESADLGEREEKKETHEHKRKKKERPFFSGLSGDARNRQEKSDKNTRKKKVNSWRIQQFSRRRKPTHSSFCCFLHRVRSEDFLSPSSPFLPFSTFSIAFGRREGKGEKTKQGQPTHGEGGEEESHPKLD